MAFSIYKKFQKFATSSIRGSLGTSGRYICKWNTNFPLGSFYRENGTTFWEIPWKFPVERTKTSCSIYIPIGIPGIFFVNGKWPHTRLSPRVPLFCSYQILTSSVIYYWSDVRQHGICQLNSIALLLAAWIMGFAPNKFRLNFCFQDPRDDCRPVDCVEKYNGWRNFFRNSTGKCEVVHECYTKGKIGELPEIVRTVILYIMLQVVSVCAMCLAAVQFVSF